MAGNSGTWRLDSGAYHEHFPDPFCDYASTVMPTNIIEAYRWCEHILSSNGVYKSAIKRVISYFITDLLIGDTDTGKEEKDKYEDFLKDTLQIKRVLARVALNLICYGEVYTSLIVPFRRYLKCPRCSAEHPLRYVATTSAFKYRWSDFQFHANCQGRKPDGTKCGYVGKWARIDRRTLEEDKVRVKVWNPKQIEVKYDDYSEFRGYIWRIPELYKTRIRQGHLHFLEHANWEIIECIRDRKNLEFAPGVLYHLYEDGLSGQEMAGHGVSSIIANFRQAWYVAVLHRFNEAMAMDGVMPLRLLTPGSSKTAAPEAGDPLLNLNTGAVMRRLRAIVRQHRNNPTEWFTAPIPVQYQALGGDAKNLAPYELLDQGVSLLLNNIGVPVEMYRGTLTLQAAPPALRLFENSWAFLVTGLDDFLQKLVDQIADAMGWEPVYVSLLSPTIADDMQDQLARLQLMMSKQISQTTGLKGLGIKFEDEQMQILEEERFVQEQQARVGEEMQQAAAMEQMAMPQQQQQQVSPQGAQQGQPGQPAGPAGAAAQGMSTAMQPTPDAPTSPQDLLAQGQAKAEEMMQLPETQRRSQLAKLKQTNPTLHSVTRAAIDSMRQQAQTAGGAQLLAQQFGGGGGGGGGQ